MDAWRGPYCAASTVLYNCRLSTVITYLEEWWVDQVDLQHGPMHTTDSRVNTTEILPVAPHLGALAACAAGTYLTPTARPGVCALALPSCLFYMRF
jgi:hypothetical protein